MPINKLECVSAEKSGDFVHFALSINGEVRQYDAPFHSYTPNLRGFDFPVEVRQILRQHATVHRELMGLLLKVMDGENVTLPQPLTTDSVSHEPHSGVTLGQRLSSKLKGIDSLIHRFIDSISEMSR